MGHQATNLSAPPIVNQVLSSHGQSLDPATRTFLGTRFGHDFSQVRVHSDETAAESARAVGARAYTVGNHIVFASGQFAPHTTSGQKLLVHEMTHVLQQHSAASRSYADSSLRIGAPGDAFEREAETAESTITPGAAQRLSSGELRVSRAPQQGTSYREDMDATEAGLLADYQRDCAGVRVLKRLEKKDTESTPLERVQSLERKVKNLPKILTEREKKKKQITMSREAIAQRLKVWGPLGRPKHIEPSPQEKEAEEQLDLTVKLHLWEKANIEPKFGSEYVFGSVEEELAKAQCELSEARLEFHRYMQTGKLSERRLGR